MSFNSILKLNVDEVEADEDSLKWSALTNAARMSCYASKRCLGPKLDSAEDNQSHQSNVKKQPEIAEAQSKVKKPLDIVEEKISSPKSQIIDSDVFRQFALMKLVNKQAKNSVRKELERKKQEYIQSREAQNEMLNELRMKTKAANELKLKAEQLIIEESENLAAELMEENRKRMQSQYEEQRQRIEHLNREQQLRLKRSLCEQIFKYQLKFGEIYQQIVNRFKQIDRNIYTNGEALSNSLRTLILSFDGIVHKIKIDDVAESDLKNAESLLAHIEKLQTDVDKEIAELSQPKVVAPVPAAAPTPPVAAAVQEAPESVSEQQQPGQTVTDSRQGAQDALSSFVSPENLAFYNDIIAFYTAKVESVKPLQADDNMKKYRSNCQKAINIPVNAISAVSAQHLQDKYDKLYGLVSGERVNTPDGLLCAMDHPLGRDFCLLLLAKKFVSQGDSTVSSNPQAAFPMAAIIVAIWQKIPEFGQLFLAYAFKECPYLVPFNIPQFKGQSIEEYYKILGYKLNDGVLEKQDQYLKRQTGLVTLYSAVMITRIRPSDGPMHPYGIENGWRWLANFLNLAPMPDISATMIFAFLQIAGAQLLQTYRAQFQKLLKCLRTEYMPRLSTIDEGGPKARLQTFLTNNKIDMPAGFLPPNFW